VTPTIGVRQSVAHKNGARPHNQGKFDVTRSFRTRSKFLPPRTNKIRFPRPKTVPTFRVDPGSDIVPRRKTRTGLRTTKVRFESIVGIRFGSL